MNEMNEIKALLNIIIIILDLIDKAMPMAQLPSQVLRLFLVTENNKNKIIKSIKKNYIMSSKDIEVHVTKPLSLINQIK